MICVSRLRPGEMHAGTALDMTGGGCYVLAKDMPVIRSTWRVGGRWWDLLKKKTLKRGGAVPVPSSVWTAKAARKRNGNELEFIKDNRHGAIPIGEIPGGGDASSW